MIAKSGRYYLDYLPENRVSELAKLFNSASIWSEYSNSSSVTEEKLRSIYDQCGLVNDKRGTFVFVFSQNDDMVAYFTFTQSDSTAKKGFSIGFKVFDKALRGRGIMSEVFPVFIQFLCSSRRANEIEAQVVDQNLASIRLLEHNGFTRVQDISIQVHGEKRSGGRYIAYPKNCIADEAH